MPTYDYHCGVCGSEAEYRNVASDSHPACSTCGSNQQMERLPSTINIGKGIRARPLTLEDTFEPKVEIIPIAEVEGECEQGHKHRATLAMLKITPGSGPCMN
jgi:putative FmdB family regulatory protein